MYTAHLLVTLVLVAAQPGTGAAVEEARQPCASPRLTLTTGIGEIVIALDRAAAPRTVSHLLRLAQGPIFNPELFSGLSESEPPASAGFYDGLTFAYTRPHLEIRTASRPPADLFRFEAELDAEALGLHRQLIKTRAEAMQVLQQELLAAYTTVKRRDAIEPQLAAWLDRWYETHQVDFLIGVSRKQINQALGYRYVAGLASLPVTRGAVVLVPLGPRQASARLGIILDDLPQRSGQWMVIGRVVQGLEVARLISLRPTIDEGPRSARPRQPVVIESVALSCGEES